MITRFTVYGEAAPQGSMRAFVIRGKDGRQRAVITHQKTRPLRSWRQDIAAAALEAGVKQIYGPVALKITFHLRRPKSLVRTKRKEPITRPDLDKLVRAVSDALEGIGYAADEQVCWLVARKRYADEGPPRAEIMIGPMTEA